jgi:alkylated DNA nucleotide flippase Atl1
MKPPVRLSKADRMRELYRIDPLDGKICEIIYEHPVATFKEIAALVGCTERQVRWRLDKPSVRKRLDDMRSTKDQLIEKAKVLGIRRLMQLVVSKDEWVALQACKVLLYGELSQVALKIPEGANAMVYEVQIGAEGQVYQTMRAMNTGDPSFNPGAFPTTLDAVAELRTLEAKP